MKTKLVSTYSYESCDEKANVIDITEKAVLRQDIFEGKSSYDLILSRKTCHPQDYEDTAYYAVAKYFNFDTREDLIKFRDNITAFLRETK